MSVNSELVKDDLYQAVNGEWLATAEIPADKSAAGGFSELGKEVEELLMADAEGMAEGRIEVDDPSLQEFIKYYQLARNFEQRQKAGVHEAKDLLDQILAVENFDEMAELLASITLRSLSSPIPMYVTADMKDAEHYALHIDVPELILPDVPYYQEDHPTGTKLLELYEKQSIELLQAYGYDLDQAKRHLQNAMELDQAWSAYQKTKEELADYTKHYHSHTPEEFRAYSQKIDLLAVVEKVVGHIPEKIILVQVDLYQHFDSLIGETVDKLRSWILVNVANGISAYFTEDVRQIGSQFQLALTGNPETDSPEKRAYNQARMMFNQPFGIYYGEKYFGPVAKADVHEMVSNMIQVYKERLDANTWLNRETIDKAITKLNVIEIMVGYPDHYPEFYQQLKVDSNLSYFQNSQQLVLYHIKADMETVGHKVDRTKWEMPADMVNAYFDPQANVICFPAAILQPPFYSIKQSRSANYGGIGAVIAHEISHAFDNNGAKIDEKGNLNNWWTEADEAAFSEKSQAMIDQWDGLPHAGGQVNGTLTVSENIADGGGLTAALEALKKEEEIDLKEFFYNWARIWCMKARPEYEELLLQIDVHSPALLRANMQVKNMDDFHEAFGIQEEDGMWLAPEDRVIIW
ncbi:M13 family metallopeptidase [Facklamia lactis]|uniref:M13 family metallopeptidase n=1 Tax=Facklamia lactis TaxID=2749967 RepID=UPI0018CEA64E|nr:M13-type metalloendopeptidase [Facklamia lactis]MBG9979673.1 hypothetical protein [Facklamia lactis]